MSRTWCPARRSDCATSSSPSGSSRKNTFVYINGPGWTPSTRTGGTPSQFSRLSPNSPSAARFHRLSKIEYRWGEHAHPERCRMTQDWKKLAADLERPLKLRTIPFGMKVFEKRDEMEAIPRIRRPKSVH